METINDNVIWIYARPEQREAIFKAFCEGVSIAMLAEQLGTKESVVRMVILRKLGLKRGSKFPRSG